MSLKTRKEKEKVIILGVINDEGSEYAFDYYVRHLHHPDNRLVIVNVIEPTIVSSNQLSMTTIFKREQQQNAEKEIIEYLREKYENKVQNNYIKAKINVISYSRTPAKILLEIANEEKASMIVIGRRFPFKFQDKAMSRESVFEYLYKKSLVPIVYAFKADDEFSDFIKEGDIKSTERARKISNCVVEPTLEKSRRISAPAMTETQRNLLEMSNMYNNQLKINEQNRRHSIMHTTEFNSKINKIESSEDEKTEA